MKRFVQVRLGQWTAVFLKASKKGTALAQDAAESNALVGELVARGITKRGAQKLVGHHAEARIREKLELFDEVPSRGGDGGFRNRAG